MQTGSIHLVGSLYSPNRERWQTSIKEVCELPVEITYAPFTEMEDFDLDKELSEVTMTDGLLVRYDSDYPNWLCAMDVLIAHQRDIPIVVWEEELSSTDSLPVSLDLCSDAVEDSGRQALNKVYRLL